MVVITIRDDAEAPWFSYFGGFCGSFYVISLTTLIHRLGAATFFLTCVIFQLIAGLVLDHLGGLGLPQRLATPGRIVGLIIAGVGVIFVNERVDLNRFRPWLKEMWRRVDTRWEIFAKMKEKPLEDLNQGWVVIGRRQLETTESRNHHHAGADENVSIQPSVQEGEDEDLDEFREARAFANEEDANTATSINLENISSRQLVDAESVQDKMINSTSNNTDDNVNEAHSNSKHSKSRSNATMYSKLKFDLTIVFPCISGALLAFQAGMNSTMGKSPYGPTFTTFYSLSTAGIPIYIYYFIEYYKKPTNFRTLKGK